MAPALAGVALLAASGWLADQGVGYLAATVVATMLGGTALWRLSARAPRLPLAITFVALLVVTAAAGRTQIRLTRFAGDPSAAGSAQAAAQQVRLQHAVERELSALRSIARRGRVLPREPGLAVHALERALGDREQRAAIVLRGDTLMAWAGTLHTDPSRLTGPSGVVATPFGLTLFAADDSGPVRTVAASLLYAAPPADRLVRGLAQRLPGDEVTEGFDFGPPSDSAIDGELRFADGGRSLFSARAVVPSAGEVRFRLLERARVRVALALLVALVAFLVAVARRGAGALVVAGGAVVVLRALTVVPLSEFSTRSRFFDPSVYFLGGGRSFTANAAALALTSGTLLLVVLLASRRVGWRLPRGIALVASLMIIAGGPFVVRALALGITPPAAGASGALWLIWSIPLCLAATALLAVASWGGRRTLGARRGISPITGPLLALVAAILAPVVWDAPGQWPQWYGILWVAAVAALVFSRPTRRALLTSAMVAGLGSTTVVWGSASRGRVELAERDVRGLAAPDSNGIALADRLAKSMEGGDLPLTRLALLERYVNSDLASSGYPVALTSWQGSAELATFGSVPFGFAIDTVRMAAVTAAREGRSVVASTRASAYGVRVRAVPVHGGVVTILVAPRTRMIGTDAYARWYGLAATESNEPPYTVQVAVEPIAASETVRWRREGNELHGDWPVQGPSGPAHAHVEVDLRRLDSLIPRGGLLVLVDLGVVALVWLIAALADGRVARWLRLRRRRIRSYRAQLSVALFLFFLVPAGAFAVWSWQQLFDDAQASRRLLVTETMRAYAGDPLQAAGLSSEARRLDTKLLLYRSGVLVSTSDSVFADLAPMGRLLRPEVALAFRVSGEESATKPEPLAGATGMLGYRVLPATNGSLVLAAPARVDDILLDRRRRDLGVLVLFATALGAVAALWLSGIAARQLARPITALRMAARAVARGAEQLPLDGDAASEFLPVFTAFRAMAHDLGASRSALEEAQRRTDAVLRTVASGVVAVDEFGRVILANPRADALLGDVPQPGEAVSRLGAPAVAARVAGFLAGGSLTDGFELERDGRTLRGQLTRLASGGAVLTLDDVTELARAQRVLAWGEMARQVAHEIKNPLTPIRLGVQHLRRARGRPDFDTVLDTNVTRILTEIDRLDEIARAFSRYGSAPEERAAAEPTDVAAIVRDVVALETLGEGTVVWECSCDADVPPALARADELREVLLNLFENARLANATRVHTSVHVAERSDRAAAVGIDVSDDGSGMDADVLPKIFEPHFSTRTSGSGLGLAITRRLVESWGGEVTIESRIGAGTTVHVVLLVE